MTLHALSLLHPHLLSVGLQRHYASFFLRFFIDLVSISIFAVAIYQARYHKRDLMMSFVSFNVGLFIILALITSGGFGLGLGFGLFAILSIIRLRSAPFDHFELGYFFMALVLALINGIGHTDMFFLTVLNVMVLATIYFVDHPSFHVETKSRRLILDTLKSDPVALQDQLEQDLKIKILDLQITELDFVKEITKVQILFLEKAHERAPAKDQ